MLSNLIISYDLNVAGQNYDAVIRSIKSLGDWAHIQSSIWYVNSQLNAEQAAKHVWANMDGNDSLIIVDSVKNEAHWYNLTNEVSNCIQTNWNR
ncbi:CRISPR-associated protein Cas2 [Psychrosphaera algicola]|uniref:CRISPR-associated protein Cas2 n=1 Tax=Psychrosphaera algicola TaxID=3023714 RepID=A0ABT5FD54_9GAMM|nr:CRISPR-associated protein Cas2 [Psychrosphaera sp. G1-22]MDC2888532.1 CRISPR-associated protein Cas2 [Psychrosphaera sp. G1-22]